MDTELRGFLHAEPGAGARLIALDDYLHTMAHAYIIGSEAAIVSDEVIKRMWLFFGGVALLKRTY